MSEPRIVRYSYEEAMKLGAGETDWERLRNMTDKEVEEAAASDPDSVPFDLDWSDAELVVPKKQPVSIRLDEDVLAFFKETGPRYQTRINKVLRSYVKAQKTKEKAKTKNKT
ncbi:MAG: hypothetical protein CVT83_00165 [Alphaproteobacteria bacterium HGW-Alphaproteobacteria-5]|nr:MAG: hypothetical protein CVT83_00165 [Alphaproteobacteria bacterium HGW-Alphaproteobacteria-5]